MVWFNLRLKKSVLETEQICKYDLLLIDGAPAILSQGEQDHMFLTTWSDTDVSSQKVVYNLAQVSLELITLDSSSVLFLVHASSWASIPKSPGSTWPEMAVIDVARTPPTSRPGAS